MKNTVENNLNTDKTKLRKVLSPIHLWGIAVGIVISGQFYGFSYGYLTGGPISFLIAFIPVSIFYFSFIFSYVELTTSIPHADGPSAYTRRAFGPFAGYLTGISTVMAFMFSPCAISIAFGRCVNFLFPSVPPLVVTVCFFICFVLINLFGVKSSAIIELVVTIGAIVGLIIFYVIAAPHFEVEKLMTDPPLLHGGMGVLGAVTFAMWFYFGVEGAAMSAEEMRNPKKDIPKGYITALFTLAITALLTMSLVGGVGNYKEVGNVDFPLPKALEAVLSPDSPVIKLMAVLALIGLASSMIGCVLSYSRQCYAMARAGYLPKFLSAVNKRYQTPHWSLILPGIICICITLSGKTDVVITIAVFSMLLMYLLAILSVFILRKKEPTLERPYKTLYPALPIIALLSLAFIIVAVVIFNLAIIKWVLLVYLAAIIYFGIWGRKNVKSYDEEFSTDED